MRVCLCDACVFMRCVFVRCVFVMCAICVCVCCVFMRVPVRVCVFVCARLGILQKTFDVFCFSLLQVCNQGKGWVWGWF